MKAILISINPKWVAKILNGEKTIEIRKRFPKDYVGWVYIYCTKGNDKHEICIYDNPIEHIIVCSRYHFLDHSEGARVSLFNPRYIKGKVVARFWCDKVVEYVNGAKIVCRQPAYLNTYKFILKDACLTEDELYDYCEDLSFKAIHINNLVIFNKPKEISEFFVFSHIADGVDVRNQPKRFKILKPLNRAPQSWCYIYE